MPLGCHALSSLKSAPVDVQSCSGFSLWGILTWRDDVSALLVLYMGWLWSAGQSHSKGSSASVGVAA